MSPFLKATPLAPLTLFVGTAALAQETTVEAQDHTFTVATVVEGLSHPWGMAFISDTEFLVTERNTGALRVGNVDGSLSDPIWEAEDLFRYEGETERSQAGLFDVKLHPDFTENGWAYLSYSRETDHGAAVTIIRGTLSQEDGDVTFGDVEDIFVMKQDDQDSSGLHFGGRMAFDPEGQSLFLSIGERRNLERAQDVADQAGSIVRLTDEGEAHPDNPSFEAEADEGEPDPYIYSMGHRNIQALTLHPDTNQLWAVDHGPEGGDVIQLIEAGNNYGWPFLTGGTDYSGAPIGVGLSMEGMTSAVHVFEDTVAPSGVTFVSAGSAFENWAGDMLVGGLVTEGLVRLRLEDGDVVSEEAIEIGHRVRDVHIGLDGNIWLLIEEEDGAVLRLTPEG
ncbi:MAG: PQQ-dependent sugar dehydrogenase [Rhodobacterales bacterium]